VIWTRAFDVSNPSVRARAKPASYVLPVKRQSEEPQTLVVGRAAEEVREHSCLVAGGMHCSQARDGDGVEPRPDIRREKLITEHAREGIPEVPQRFGRLDALPVEPLEGFNNWKGRPIYSFNVPGR
jgi:hypothetical protein